MSVGEDLRLRVVFFLKRITASYLVELCIMSSSHLPYRVKPMKRARLIMNPVSGVDEPNPMKLPDIITALEAEDIRAELAFTRPDESPTAIAQQAAQEEYDMVIVGGGDGTVSEVAKGLLHAAIPLGIIPIGTYNNIARSLNLPTNLTQACQVLAQGQIRTIDVGQAVGQADEEHYFFEAAGVGLDAALFPLGEEIKAGQWQRMIQALRLALSYQPQQIKLQFDRPPSTPALSTTRQRRFLRRRPVEQHEIQLQALLVVVANGPYYGSGFTVAPEAIIDDGLLTVSLYRDFSKWELLRHFWSISRGQFQPNPKIQTYQVAEVRLNSKSPLPVHVDGHPIGELPVTFKVIRQALKVILP